MAIACGTQVLRWDTTTGKSLPSIEVGTGVKGLTFFPDGKRIAVTAYHENPRYQSLKVAVFDSTGKKIRSALAGFQNVPAISVSPDGKLLAFRQREDTLRVWDYEDDKTAFSLSTHSNHPWQVGAIAFSPDGKYLAVNGGYSGMDRKQAPDEEPIVLFDLKSGKVATRLRGHSAAVRSLSFSAAGDILLSCGRAMIESCG